MEDTKVAPLKSKPVIGKKPKPSPFKVPFIIASILFIGVSIAAILLAMLALGPKQVTPPLVDQPQIDKDIIKDDVAVAPPVAPPPSAPAPLPVPAPDPLPPVAEPCANQIIDIRYGTFEIPCGWNSYFEYQPVEERSFGFVGMDPLILLGASDASVGDAGVGVRLFSTTLGNYDADPLGTEMAGFAGDPDVAISDVTSATGIAFKQVTFSGGFFSGSPTNYYYAQNVVGPDEVWMVTFSNNVGGIVAEDLINTFEWGVL